MIYRNVFVTGGTGYLGRPLLAALRSRGHTVRALIRPGSEHKLPDGVPAIVGDALSAASYAARVPPADTLIHLVGTPNPSPRKAAEFACVDGPSGLAAIEAARAGGVEHLVYVSVAQPAPVMQAYIATRAAVESRLRESCESGELNGTILRPWYVLGPGHWWPYLLLPLYALARRLPATRPGAERLGLVRLREMVRTLVAVVEAPAVGVQVLDVVAIRRIGRLPPASTVAA